jgi:hypothetical protein
MTWRRGSPPDQACNVDKRERFQPLRRQSLQLFRRQAQGILREEGREDAGHRNPAISDPKGVGVHGYGLLRVPEHNVLAGLDQSMLEFSGILFQDSETSV